MKVFVVLSCLALVLLSGSYVPEEVHPEIPSCIETIMEGLLSEPPRDTPATLWKISTPESTWYYMPAGLELAGILMDDQCNPICSPQEGTTPGDCPELAFATRELVWQDERIK